MIIGGNYKIGVVLMRPFKISRRIRYKMKYVFPIVLITGPDEPPNIDAFFEEISLELR